MKKLATTILAITIIFTLGATGVSASSGNHHSGRNKNVAVCRFVDENKDGICDIHSKNCKFIDENKDGICDNCPNGGTCQKDGTGKRAGHHKSGEHHS